MEILKVDGVSVKFGGLTAVNNLHFSVNRGEIFSIIGPNGAGKTTAFNTITGIYKPTNGQILLNGSEIRRHINQTTVILIVIIGLILGFGLLLTLNLEDLWQQVIVANYQYRQPFPWQKAISELLVMIKDLPFQSGLLPFLLGTITGIYGSIAVWRQISINPDVAARTGIARTFQNIKLFRQMTAMENILVGMDSTLNSGLFSAIFRLTKFRTEHKDSTTRALEILKFVGLSAFAHSVAGSLSYGHQRRLEIARALASSPKMILLDEPAAGMNPTETSDLIKLIRKIRDTGLTVILIEHHMKVVMAISDRILVLDCGNRIALDKPEVIQKDPIVISAYLGKGDTQDG